MVRSCAARGGAGIVGDMLAMVWRLSNAGAAEADVCGRISQTADPSPPLKKRGFGMTGRVWTLAEMAAISMQGDRTLESDEATGYRRPAGK